VAEAGHATGDTLARLRLSLPPRDYELITQANEGLEFLGWVYGIEFSEVDACGAQPAGASANWIWF
jgi:hypothetical protein